MKSDKNQVSAQLWKIIFFLRKYFKYYVLTMQSFYSDQNPIPFNTLKH